MCQIGIKASGVLPIRAAPHIKAVLKELGCVCTGRQNALWRDDPYTLILRYCTLKMSEQWARRRGGLQRCEVAAPLLPLGFRDNDSEGLRPHVISKWRLHHSRLSVDGHRERVLRRGNLKGAQSRYRDVSLQLTDAAYPVVVPWVTMAGVFAGGDIVRGASLVVWAVRDGRDAAESIDRYIQARQAAGAEAPTRAVA